MIRHSCTPFRILLRNPKLFSTTSQHLQFRPPKSFSSKQLINLPHIKLLGDNKEWDKITQVINSFDSKEKFVQVCIAQLKDTNNNLSVEQLLDRRTAYKYILHALIESKSPLVWEFLLRTQNDGLLAGLFGINRLIRLYDSYAEMYISSTTDNDTPWRAEDNNTIPLTNFSENIESPSLIVEKEIANYITLWLRNKTYQSSAKIVDDAIFSLLDSSHYKPENVILSILLQIQQNLLKSDKLKIASDENNLFSAVIPNDRVVPSRYIISQSMFDFVLHSSILRLTHLKRFESVSEILKYLKETGNIFSSTEIRFPMISQGTFIALVMHACSLLKDLQATQTALHNTNDDEIHTHNARTKAAAAADKRKSMTHEEIIKRQLEIENLLRGLLSLVEGMDPLSFHYREMFFSVIHSNCLTDLKLQLFQEVLLKGIPTSGLLHCFIIKDYGTKNDFGNAKYVFDKLRKQGNIPVPNLYKDPRVFDAPNFKYRIQTKYIRKPGSVAGWPSSDTTGTTTTSRPAPTHFWGVDGMAYEALCQAAAASGSPRLVKEGLEEVLRDSSFRPDFGFLMALCKLFVTFSSDQLVPYVMRITKQLLQRQKMQTANWQPHTDLPSFAAADVGRKQPSSSSDVDRHWRMTPTAWTREDRKGGRGDSHAIKGTSRGDPDNESDVCYHESYDSNINPLNEDEITKIFYHAVVASKLFGNSDRCLRILKELRAMHVKPTPRIMKDVFIRLLTDGRYGDVLQLYRDMGAWGVPKDLRHVTQMIEALAQSNRLSDALRAIAMLEEQGTPAFIRAYLVVIKKLLPLVFQDQIHFHHSKSAKLTDSQALPDLLRLSVHILRTPRKSITAAATTYLSEEDEHYASHKLVEMEEYTGKFERKLKIYSDIERYLLKLCHSSPDLSTSILAYLQSHDHPEVAAVTQRLQTSLKKEKEKGQSKGRNKPSHKHHEMKG